MTNSEIIVEVFKVAGQVGIFGIAAYWIQKLIDSSANKRLEEYKKTLALLESKETSLHTKRHEVIESLYGKLVDLDFSMRTLTNPVKFAPPDHEKFETELVSQANESFQSFHIFYEKNKIYFSQKTCEILNNIRDAFYQALLDYNQHRLFRAHGVDDKALIKEAYQNLKKSYNSVKDEIPKLRKDLEIEFRGILIVE